MPWARAELRCCRRQACDPYGAGWFFKIKPADASVLDGLMDAAAYAKEIGA